MISAMSHVGLRLVGTVRIRMIYRHVWLQTDESNYSPQRERHKKGTSNQPESRTWLVKSLGLKIK